MFVISAKLANNTIKLLFAQATVSLTFCGCFRWLVNN